MCFVRIEQVLCDDGQVSANHVPSTHMTEHAKKCHKVTQNYCVLQVFQRDSVLSTWIRGLTGQSIPQIKLTAPMVPTRTASQPQKSMILTIS